MSYEKICGVIIACTFPPYLRTPCQAKAINESY